MNRVILTTLLLAFCATIYAQDGELLEYQQEIGGGAGIMNYIGDSGGSPLKHPGPMVSVFWRRNFNQRMVVRTHMLMGHISGNTKGNFVPTDPLSETPAGGTPTTVEFSRNVMEAGAQFEFNFFGYGRGAAYKGLKPWTPYLLFGAGVTTAFGGGGKFVGGLNIPVGIGLRYKVRQRLNLGFEWAVRFTTSDRLDDSGNMTKLNDPYGTRSGMFKNKDCYTTAMFSISYDISPKYRKCNN
ncbi:MAG: DUF6089 family protein [Bacteroidaceae bacterium]|nr:DUF6089 family protein [Bacteroidaceae bacterium]